MCCTCEENSFERGIKTQGAVCFSTNWDSFVFEASISGLLKTISSSVKKLSSK